MEEWPSISETILGLTSLDRSSVAQLGALDERVEGAVAEVGGVDGGAALGGEDEAARLVEGSQPLHLLGLAGEVGSEGRYGVRGKPEGAPALGGLGFAEDVCFVGVGEGAAHAQEAALEVYVIPLEGEELADHRSQ